MSVLSWFCHPRAPRTPLSLPAASHGCHGGSITSLQPITPYRDVITPYRDVITPYRDVITPYRDVMHRRAAFCVA